MMKEIFGFNKTSNNFLNFIKDIDELDEDVMDNYGNDGDEGDQGGVSLGGAVTEDDMLK